MTKFSAEDKALVKKHAEKKSVSEAMSRAWKWKKMGKKTFMRNELREALREAREWERRAASRRTKNQIEQDRAAMLEAVRTSEREVSEHDFDSKHAAADLEALAKQGKLDREVKEFYDSARNTHGLFGGAVAMKRKRAYYTAK